MCPTLKQRQMPVKRQDKDKKDTHMPSRYDEDDVEYLELLSQYERYVQKSTGTYEDFDEWLEIEYGSSRRKALKRNTKKGRDKEF